MDDEQRRECLRAVSPEEIETKRGRGGREQRYVSHPAVTRRLIRAFPCGWTWSVRDTRIDVTDGEGYVVVLGRLEAGGCHRDAWGGAEVSKRGMDLGDGLKAAGSYALRKAASLYGVALELWDGGGVEAAPATPEQGRALWAAARDAGIEGKAAVKVRCEEVLGRTIPSFTELTRVEASRVIDEFQRMARDADRGHEEEG